MTNINLMSSINNIDLQILESRLGQHSSIQKNQIDSLSTLSGSFTLGKTNSDIYIHCSNSVELETTKTCIKRPPGISFGVLLKGRIKFSLDDKAYEIRVGKHDNPLCFAFNLTCPTQWERHLIKGNHVIKTVVALPHYWFSQRFGKHCELSPIASQLLLQHKQVFIVDANEKLIKLCKDILSSGSKNLPSMEIEGLALLFIANSLKIIESSLKHQNNPRCKQNHNDHDIRSEALKIRSYIEEHILSISPIRSDLAHVSKSMGHSISTLQRQFKLAFNQTIGSYIQTRRLELARKSLLSSSSIGEIAYLTGYKHTSNFTLAFKKRFDITPGEFRELTQTHQDSM